ncbi:MAG: CDP-alcohol phosphatidyltransferase family protein [Rhodoferax sp.]
MLDRFVLPLVRPPLQVVARGLVRAGVGANALTWSGFAIGLAGALLITHGAFGSALLAIAVSRLCDALDGMVARLRRPTDLGGFLDITLDFVFYASIPLAFALADPLTNALAAAVVLAAFVGTASSFLAFAVLAEKRGMHSLNYPGKSFYFLGGLTEGTETLGFFAFACAWPQHFAPLAYGFATLCAFTLISRVRWGVQAFSEPMPSEAEVRRHE